MTRAVHRLSTESASKSAFMIVFFLLLVAKIFHAASFFRNTFSECTFKYDSKKISTWFVPPVTLFTFRFFIITNKTYKNVKLYFDLLLKVGAWQ